MEKRKNYKNFLNYKLNGIEYGNQFIEFNMLKKGKKKVKWNLFTKTYKNPLKTYFKNIGKFGFYKCKFTVFLRILRGLSVLRKKRKIRFSKFYNLRKKQKILKRFSLNFWFFRCTRSFYSLRLSLKYFKVWRKYNSIFINSIFFKYLTKKFVAGRRRV